MAKTTANKPLPKKATPTRAKPKPKPKPSTAGAKNAVSDKNRTKRLADSQSDSPVQVKTTKDDASLDEDYAADEHPSSGDEDLDPPALKRTRESKSRLSAASASVSENERPGAMTLATRPVRSTRGTNLADPDKPRPKRTSEQVRADREAKEHQASQKITKKARSIVAVARMDVDEVIQDAAEEAAAVRSTSDLWKVDEDEGVDGDEVADADYEEVGEEEEERDERDMDYEDDEVAEEPPKKVSSTSNF